jgi:hypothetical protein
VLFIAPDGTVSLFPSGLDQPQFLTVQVPEPASVGVLVFGTAGLLLRRRSARRR